MTIYQGDCLEVMKTLPDNSVDAVITDPPYFKVKKEQWDNQCSNPEQFCLWLKDIVKEWQRILKPNGSLYCFASSQMNAHVEILIKQYFKINNNIVWAKHNTKQGGFFRRHEKEKLRCFATATERIIFAEHYGADTYAKGATGYKTECDKLRGFVFESLRSYLQNEWKRAGLTPDDANKACNTASMAGRHFFAKSQWCLPTKKHYTKMQEYANKKSFQPEYLRREYEDLRREYEDLRRPFNVNSKIPYTDVWEFEPVSHYTAKHPCEKPQDLLKHIINCSTKQNHVVLDCFMGTGSTGIACHVLNRRFIGIELDYEYYKRAKQRIEECQQSTIFYINPEDVEIAEKRIAAHNNIFEEIAA